MRIGVLGAGYVGMVTGVCLAEMGNTVTVVDRDADVVDLLQAGHTHLFEPGLDEMKLRNQITRRLSFASEVGAAVKGMEVVFIAVGTPPREDGSVDLDDIRDAARAIAREMDGYRLIVIKSTVPPGTNRELSQLIGGETEQPFDVVSNPEFLKEGTAIDDFLRPDRVVVGARSERARQIMRRVYNPFFRIGYRLMETDPESAEMIKYASNVMLAARISLMNEISVMCQSVGADVERVRIGVGLDKRIGASFLYPGLGYGGSCFPKDVKGMIHLAEQTGIASGICHAIDAANARQRNFFLPFILEEFGEDLTGRRFGLLGLAYKPRTDDVRESPALSLARELMRRGAKVCGIDPEAELKARRALPELEVMSGLEAVAKDADALFLCTEWNEFRSLDWDALKRVMRRPIIFDGRNIYDPDTMREYGFTYYSVGRVPVRPEEGDMGNA